MDYYHYSYTTCRCTRRVVLKNQSIRRRRTFSRFGSLPSFPGRTRCSRKRCSRALRHPNAPHILSSEVCASHLAMMLRALDHCFDSREISERFDGVVGYRICLTHRRSPVRTRVEPFLFLYLQVVYPPTSLFPVLNPECINTKN